MTVLEALSIAGKALEILSEVSPLLPSEVQEDLTRMRAKLTEEAIARQNALADAVEEARFRGGE